MSAKEAKANHQLWLAYAVAVGGVAAAVALRSAISAIVGEFGIFLLFYPVVLLSAALGGVGPGLCATILTAVAANYFLMEPRGAFGIESAADAVNLALFVTINLAISIIGGMLRRERQAKLSSEIRYRRLFEAAHDGVLLVDSNTRKITDANPFMSQLLGYSRDELVGRELWEIGLVKDVETNRTVFGQLLREGHVRYEDLPLRAKTGETREIEFVSNVYDEDGRAVIQCNLRDITTRKQAQKDVSMAVEEYERQVRLFEGVSSTTPDLVYVFDLQGRFLYVNRRLLEVWGMQLPDVIGKTFRELGYEQWYHDMHMREIAQVIETKRPLKGEVPFKAPRTGIFGVYEYIFTPVLGKDGQVELVAGTAREVTQRKQREDELRRLRDQLKAELEAMNRLHELSTRFLRQEDLPTLFGGILEAAIAIVGAQGGHVHLLDPSSGELPIVAQRGLEQAFLDYFSHIKPGQIACGAAIQSSQCVVVEDVAKSPLFLADAQALELKLANQIRAMICTPLVTRAGDSVGVLSVDFPQPHSPSDRDLRLLDLLARQAADFIERKRAEDELNRLQDQLKAELEAMTRFHELGTRFMQQEDQHLLLEAILDAAITISGASKGNIQLLATPSGELGITVHRGFNPEFVEYFSHIGAGQAACGTAMQNRQCVIVEDITVSPIFLAQPRAKELKLAAGIRALICTPLLTWTGHLVGVLSVHFEKIHSPSDRDLRLLDLLARQAADFIQRRQTEEEVRQAREELARANEKLERQVQERTAKLQETVGELEHFSYTITHDMRAPLRAMQGFGRLLLGQCEDCLNPQRRDFLRKIAESAERMDCLITDALNYTKIVRKDFPLEPVHTDKLLRSMVESYPQFQSPKAAIRTEGNLPVVLANEAGLTQCFSNLLSNAVKFVKPGEVPTVRVWAENRGGYVRFWVEDNGIGIAKRYQEQIFVMFQRLSKNYEGTGIGLALVSKAVERMQGKVGVESEEGQGSRFWIELKACECPTPTYAGEAAALH